jgi:hypothetical protein
MISSNVAYITIWIKTRSQFLFPSLIDHRTKDIVSKRCSTNVIGGEEYLFIFITLLDEADTFKQIIGSCLTTTEHVEVARNDLHNSPSHRFKGYLRSMHPS